jgi:transcriptional regulator with XRE-family HTH domain
MKQPSEGFGSELRRLRREGNVKYSQAQLAKLADVTPSYISMLETGQRTPTPAAIRRLGPHLGVSANYLMKYLGMIEMDFAATLADHREQVKKRHPELPQEQLDEMANFLTYLEFKLTALSRG